MFDSASAQLLRSAPPLPGLNPDDLPAVLTQYYATLASSRLRGGELSFDELNDDWTLGRIADTYELTAALQLEPQLARAAAFVAATAQQIIARRTLESPTEQEQVNIHRDFLNPALSSVLLFLIAEQFADANEAASIAHASSESQIYESKIVSEHIVDLGKGRLKSIVQRSRRWRRDRIHADLDERVFATMLETLAAGIELFAAQFLRLDSSEEITSRFSAAKDAFELVIKLSANNEALDPIPRTMNSIWPGPHHLASLLLSATDGISRASLVSVPPPKGADGAIWERWIRSRSDKFPYMWPNHRDAVSRGFHETGVSSVVVLPTGAGKTTISSLKIAGVLSRGKKVVFLAPTHALVEQLTEDLQEMFPQELLGSVVSSDFDLLLQDDAIFKEIEVMTPERCLAMISFAPEAFKDVGLMVFDECHLLSPQSGKIRRALDGMLCVLGFNKIAPEADLLFLSAMIRNGDELAEWLSELTGRPSLAVDLVWKPSRQARGVVTYSSEELETSRENAVRAQRQENLRLEKTAKTVRKIAEREIVAQPYAIWGLQHNWLSDETVSVSTTPLLSTRVQLAGKLERGSSIRLTPNANHVAASIASSAASNGLKTIVFVNTKKDAVKVARDISQSMEKKSIDPNASEQLRWNALELELGDLKHSLLSGPRIAVPHNSAMLRLERELAERMFKRPDGATVIVATPTLAQGLNLPAHLAILAGDKRADGKQRQSLEAHEILNAAARAGRAGHLANGLVLLIPEPIIKFHQEDVVLDETIQKLKAILPENDRCVTINDPLQVVLDRVTNGDMQDPQVKYTINRFAVLSSEESDDQIFDLGRSLAAFKARQELNSAVFDYQVGAFRREVDDRQLDDADRSSTILASQSGLSPEVVLGLRERIQNEIGDLPTDISGWVKWMTEWLIADEPARVELLSDLSGDILAVAGRPKTGTVDEEALRTLLDGALAWIRGEPLSEIEAVLGGEPNKRDATKRYCPQARTLVSSVIPRGYSFALGLIAHVLKQNGVFDLQPKLDRNTIECMSSALRLGFDTPQKLQFSTENKAALGRVQAHKLWNEI